MKHLGLRELIIMLNNLPASTCKFGVPKKAFSLFLKDPSEQNRSVKHIYKLSEAKFWYCHIGLDLSFQKKSTF